jgi:hypothetical protein
MAAPQGLPAPILSPDSDPHLSKFHSSLLSRDEVLKTLICQNSESHRPEPTKREAIKTLLSEEAVSPGVLSNIVQNMSLHYCTHALQPPCHCRNRVLIHSEAQSLYGEDRISVPLDRQRIIA